MENSVNNNEETYTPNFDFYELVKLTGSLVEILNRESEILRSMKIQDIEPMQEEKKVLSLKLEAQHQALRMNPALKSTLSATQIEELRTVSKQYDSAVKLYEAEFYRAKTINDITVRMIAEVVEEHLQKDRAYSVDGTKAGNINTRTVANTPAFKLNEQV